MTFFTFQPQDHSKTVSSWLWLYFAFTIAATALVAAVGHGPKWFQARKLRHMVRKEDAIHKEHARNIMAEPHAELGAPAYTTSMRM